MRCKSLLGLFRSPSVEAIGSIYTSVLRSVSSVSVYFAMSVRRSLCFTMLGLLATQELCAASHDHSIRVMIKYKSVTHSLTMLKKHINHRTQLSVTDLTPMANGAYWFIATSKDESLSKEQLLDHALQQLRAAPEVLYAVEDRLGYFKPVPDPVMSNLDSSAVLSHESQWDEFMRPAGVMLESQPGLQDGAWAHTRGAANNEVVVAVLDTGIALNESIVNNLVKNEDGSVGGWNFSGNNNNVLDETQSYHGTHVAGTIAGYGQVMTGMGDALKILTVKIPGANSLFYESAVINGIYWSVGADVPGVPHNSHPAKVLNMSFGVDLGPQHEIDYCDQALQEAVFFARDQGAVLVAAAGNDNVWEHLNAPAACNGTIKVASTGPEGLRSYFSNYGPSVSFAAPGGDKHYGVTGGILSTVNPGGGYKHSGFDFYQGTSMATPHVAGVAGLIYSVSQHALSAEQVEQLLYVTTHDFGYSADDNKSCVGKKPCGHGILDAEYAVNAALAAYDDLFTAPQLDTINHKQCAQEGIMKVRSGSSLWIKKISSCDATSNYQHPHVQQNKDGSIDAHYGSVVYQLDQNAYQECHVIGYDGVGCYRTKEVSERYHG